MVTGKTALEKTEYQKALTKMYICFSLFQNLFFFEINLSDETKED